MNRRVSWYVSYINRVSKHFATISYRVRQRYVTFPGAASLKATRRCYGIRKIKWRHQYLKGSRYATHARIMRNHFMFWDGIRSLLSFWANMSLSHYKQAQLFQIWEWLWLHKQFEYLVQCQSDCTSTVLKRLNIHDHLKNVLIPRFFFILDSLSWSYFDSQECTYWLYFVCGSNRTMSGA